MMTENQSVSSQEEIFSPTNSSLYKIANTDWSVPNSNEPKSNQQKDVCKVCFTCVFKVLISAGISVWLIYAIIALSNENMKDIKDDCPNSQIWPCLCTMIGVCGISLILESKPKSDKNNPNILGLCLNIACFIWMTVELFDNCAKNKLTEYDIYKLLFIFYWIYVGCFSLLIIITLCMCCSLCFNENLDNEPLEKPIVDNLDI